MDFTGLSQQSPVGAPLSGGQAPQRFGIRGSVPEDDAVRFFFNEFDAWRPILTRLGLAPDTVIRLAIRATENGTDFQGELLASNLVSESETFAAIAEEFGLGFIEDLDPDRLIVREEDYALLLRSRSKHVQVWMKGKDGRTHPLIAPTGMSLRAFKAILQRNRRILPTLRMTTPQALRRAIIAKASRAMAHEACTGLDERRPKLSARTVVSGSQGAMLGGVAVLLALGLAFYFWPTFFVAYTIATLFFAACVVLRVAAGTAASPPAPPGDLEWTPPGPLPMYSVLVALHKEAEVVPQLLAALEQLVWPRAKLEIKLVCEADDRDTLQAIARFDLPHHFEVVEVPPGLPRTKPKALNYALQLAKGEFVVLYDAEDRPHPLQLLEAWRCFADADEKLACLQAPLEITNGQAGAIPRLFAFEYSALFRGLLPFLSGRRAVVPLGGTSNHLRAAALRDVDGWDPFNVTEDADLGIRLARFGYRIGTLALPTLEDAPEAFRFWLPQRTRWFKGWMHTWLVHMREPFQLMRDLGPWSFCYTQIVCAGLVASALIHPFLIGAAAYIGVQLLLHEPVRGWGVITLTVDVLNIVFGYMAFLALGWQSLEKPRRRGFWRIVVLTPPYWMMMSIAAWRALWQLFRKPHHWEKTPHFRTREQ